MLGNVQRPGSLVVPRRFGRKVGQIFGAVHDIFVSKDLVSPLEKKIIQMLQSHNISTYIYIYPHDYFHESHENQSFHIFLSPHFANKQFPMSPEFLSSPLKGWSCRWDQHYPSGALCWTL